MDQRSGMIMMFLSAVLFSFKPVFAKLAYLYGVQPHVLLGMRMLIAVPLFWIFLLITDKGGKVKVTTKDVLFFAAAGFLGFFAAAESSFFALTYIDASVNTLIIYTYPSIVTVLSFFIFGEHLRIRKALALAMVFGGTVFVLNVFNDTLAGISPTGVVLSFSSALFFSLYYIMIKLFRKKISSTRLTTYFITAGGAFVIAAWHGAAINQPYQVWLYAFGLASVSTLCPFLLLGEGIRRVGPSNASIYSAIGPVSTITLAHILLGEKLSPIQFIGAAFIIAGIMTLGTTSNKATQK
jgi:drug/metabolite transporter (DMT)-like permease